MLAAGIDAVAKNTYNPFVSESWWVYGVAMVIAVVGAVIFIYFGDQTKDIIQSSESKKDGEYQTLSAEDGEHDD